SPSVVKVVIGENHQALYFSRNAIPYVRDYPIEKWLQFTDFYKHIGIYAYKNEILNQFVSLPISKLEKTEKLEQLRLLEAGVEYLCYETNIDMLSIDTTADLEEARRRFSQK
ncbi:MAG TPA: 3-deoxy-manno-octulosonate cytidylyltransferase, partial [Bacteroidetes bacterium]|nr:3-deoxy-manno-octulosonate cytidylyltransferase [Bacteroidota bacterium]